MHVTKHAGNIHGAEANYGDGSVQLFQAIYSPANRLLKNNVEFTATSLCGHHPLWLDVWLLHPYIPRLHRLRQIRLATPLLTLGCVHIL